MNMIFNCRNNGTINCEVHYINNGHKNKSNFVLSEPQTDHIIFFKKWKSSEEVNKADNILTISKNDIICIKIP